MKTNILQHKLRRSVLFTQIGDFLLVVDSLLHWSRYRRKYMLLAKHNYGFYYLISLNARCDNYVAFQSRCSHTIDETDLPTFISAATSEYCEPDSALTTLSISFVSALRVE